MSTGLGNPIGWCDCTWNVIRGCSLVSAGCTNCYAMRQAHRFAGPGGPYEGLTRRTEHGPVWTGLLRFAEDVLDAPLRWRSPRRIFVNSMSDLFHEDVPDEWIDRVFAVMALAQRHTFIILTKRPERMREYCTALTFERLIECCNRSADGGKHRPGAYNLGSINHLSVKARFVAGEKTAYRALPHPPLPNVQLIVSVENQATADARIPLLLQTPAAVRGVSYEPALGPVDFNDMRDWLTPVATKPADAPRLDWIIVGAESGPGARPFDIAWARSVVDQCKGANRACFVKQLGQRPYSQAVYAGNEIAGGVVMQLLDRKGADIKEWPEDLRVRELPA